MVRLSAPKLRAKHSLIIRQFLHAPTAKAERHRSPFAPADARVTAKLPQRQRATAATPCRPCREAQLQESEALETTVA